MRAELSQVSGAVHRIDDLEGGSNKHSRMFHYLEVKSLADNYTQTPDALVHCKRVRHVRQRLKACVQIFSGGTKQFSMKTNLLGEEAITTSLSPFLQKCI